MNTMILRLAVLAALTLPGAITMAQEEEDTTLIYRLNDIWALEAINDTVIPPAGEGNVAPYLEIHVRDMAAHGSDGCNRVSAGMDTLDLENLKFGVIMGTRMMCPSMTTPDAFLKAMGLVAHYKIDGLKLFMFDADRKEVLRFRKVD